MKATLCPNKHPAGPATSGSKARPPPLWLLVLLTFSGTLAMHMFVPALATAASELRATPAAVQSTIGLYILGLAAGQLVWGPVADQFGRRPTLLLGLGIFTVASSICMLADSIAVLVAARFVQALGGSAGLLLGRTIVRDTSGPEGMMKRLATMSLVLMVGPGLAPLFGAYVVSWFDWRYIFVVFVALGAAGLVLVWRLLPETRPLRDNRTAQRSLSAEYGQLLRSPTFLSCVVGGGCSTSAFYAFISVAPFLFIQRFDQTVTTVGYYLFLLCVGIALGNLLSSRLASRRLTSILVRANGLNVLCASLLVGQMLWMPTQWGILATMFFYCVGTGMCGPAALAKAMSIQPAVAGSASGLYGAGQMVIGALCTSVVGHAQDLGLAAACVLLVASITGQIAFRIVLRSALRRRAD